MFDGFGFATTKKQLWILKWVILNDLKAGRILEYDKNNLFSLIDSGAEENIELAKQLFKGIQKTLKE